MWIGDIGRRTRARMRLLGADSILGPLLFECGAMVSDQMTARGVCQPQWSGSYDQERDLYPRGRRRGPLEAQRLSNRWTLEDRSCQASRYQHGVQAV